MLRHEMSKGLWCDFWKKKTFFLILNRFYADLWRHPRIALIFSASIFFRFYTAFNYESLKIKFIHHQDLNSLGVSFTWRDCANAVCTSRVPFNYLGSHNAKRSLMGRKNRHLTFSLTDSWGALDLSSWHCSRLNCRQPNRRVFSLQFAFPSTSVKTAFQYLHTLLRTW